MSTYIHKLSSSTYIYKLSSKETNKVYIVANLKEKTIEEDLLDTLELGKKRYEEYLYGIREYDINFELLQYDDCNISLLEDNIDVILGRPVKYSILEIFLIEYAKKFDCVNIPLCECGEYYYIKNKNRHMTTQNHINLMTYKPICSNDNIKITI